MLKINQTKCSHRVDGNDRVSNSFDSSKIDFEYYDEYQLLK